MSWLRLDDGFTSHPKLITLGPPALRWQFLELMSYCARHRTDGYFPPEIAPPKLLDRCIDVGLVELDSAGPRIHDWEKFNPTRDPTGAVRQQRWRNAQRNGRVTDT